MGRRQAQEVPTNPQDETHAANLAQEAAAAEGIALCADLVRARKEAGLSQSQVARRLGIKTSAVARLEEGGGYGKQSLSIATLREYAEVVGCRLEIKLLPR